LDAGEEQAGGEEQEDREEDPCGFRLRDHGR
jgi:hypothetical protein